MDGLTVQSPDARRASPRDQKLWAAAQALETSFIAEMLKGAKIGAPRQEFGGGTGEDQFASMLQDQQADMLQRRGGFGLAESIYQAMRKGEAND